MTNPAEGTLGTILPCPFCGSEPTVMGSGEGHRGLMIHCIGRDCPNPSVSYYNHETARVVWNRRSLRTQGGNTAEPAAWLVGWHRANGDAGLKAYVNEDDARKAAKNLEAYSASETMADVQPLYAAPTPSPAESVTTWQPIGSEPKGERILLCWADHPTLAAHVELGKHSASGAYTNTYGKAFSDKPTHWMPLPDAPALSREEQHG